MYKKGFSLTELMIIMIIVAIALAASIPVITKKHFRLPQATEHGTYICYYDENNQLHEKRYSNKFGMNKAILDHVTDNCVFNPPKKASYFQITAVGGGGGGGDSGYTGGNMTTTWSQVYYISPFNITEADLNAKNITLSDFRTYAGTLYAFARGTDSGRGGSVNYVVQNGSGSSSPSSSSCSNVSTTQDKVCITGPQFLTRTEYGCKDNKTGITTWYSSPISRDTCISGNNTKFTIVTRSRSVRVADCDCTSNNCYNSPTSVISSSICGAINNSYTYNWKLADGNGTSGPTAGRARRGAYCVSSSGIAGNIGLSYTKNVTAWTNGADGVDMKTGGARAIPTSCTNATAGDGNVVCSNQSVSQACDKSNASYSEYSITDGSSTIRAKAYSAWKAGLGGRRTMSNSQCNNPTTSASETATATYSDKFGGIGDTNSTYLSNSSTSGDGWCDTGNLTARDYCNSIGSSREAGYCLKRKDDTLSPNGKYTYRYSYDENYLTYGNAGEAGEYKSMVIRSFKDMDTTIRIGRGGNAGIKNSGQAGSDGSSTSMGNLIYAAGGKGGKGGITEQNEVLPEYNQTEFENETYIHANCADKTAICTVGNAKYDASKCTLLNNCTSRSLKFIRKAGGEEGPAPLVKELTSNLYNYVIPKVQDAITELFAQSGHGGKGGGVVHSCWAGQWITIFEGYYMPTSIYPSGSAFRRPDGTGAAIPNGAIKLPDDCRSNYEITAGTNGVDGALMIRW